MKRFLIGVLCACAVSLPMSAQWTDDWSENTKITPSSLSLYSPESVTSSDGTTYLYFIVATTPFSYRLQVINPEGERIFRSGGYTIAENRNITYVRFAKNLMVDKEGNCVLAVMDLRDCPEEDQWNFGYYIYKFGPDGEMLWDAPVALPMGDVSDAANALWMEVAENNDYLFSYSTGSYNTRELKASLYRIHPDGSAAWENPIILGTYQSAPISFVTRGEGDGCIAVYSKGDVNLYAMAYDEEGNSSWEEEKLFYTGGFYDSTRPLMVCKAWSAPEGGAILGVMGGNYDSRIAWIRPDGSLAGGTESGIVLNSMSWLGMRPNVTTGSDGAVYASYVVTSDDQLTQGIYSRKFDKEGNFGWDGKEMTVAIPEKEKQYKSPYVFGAPNSNLIFFYQMMDSSSSSDPVGNYMVEAAADGTPLSSPVNFATSATVKNEFSVEGPVDGKYYYAGWTENRTGNYYSPASYYMQRMEAVEESGVGEISVSMGNQDQYFTLEGLPAKASQKGLLIVKRADGTIEKILK